MPRWSSRKTEEPEEAVASPDHADVQAEVERESELFRIWSEIETPSALGDALASFDLQLLTRVKDLFDLSDDDSETASDDVSGELPVRN